MSLLQAYLRSPRTQRILNRKPKDKGFSLIELVVVVAVLAILAAIAIPAFNGLRQDAAKAGAKSNLAQIAKECAYQIARGQATIARTALVDAAGITYNATAQLATCPATPAATATAEGETYGIFLQSGVKATGATGTTGVNYTPW